MKDHLEWPGKTCEEMEKSLAQMHVSYWCLNSTSVGLDRVCVLFFLGVHFLSGSSRML